MCAFLVNYARDNQAQVVFPADDSRRAGRGTGKTRSAPLEGTVCPLCGRGKMEESPRAFSCAEKDCACTIWKDALTRGGGPEMTEKLLRLLLEKKEVRGSTGTIRIREGRIEFYPNGSEQASVNRSLSYQKAGSGGRTGAKAETPRRKAGGRNGQTAAES